MRFGFLTEGDTPRGTTHFHRYHELVEQVQVAERVGFDLFGASEQHFAIGGASTSSPEVLYAYMTALTSRMRFAFAVALMPSRINHPLRTAERLAALDILSHGRIEAIFGRGNTMLALRAFEVSAEQNRAEMAEGIDLLLAAFRDDPFDFVGEYFKVPPRSLVPKPYTLPHPPLSVAATSAASHAIAAQKGLGVTSFANFSGMEALQRNLAAYDTACEANQQVPGRRVNKGLLISGLVCEDTNEQARERFVPLLDYVKLAVNAYDQLANRSDDYKYTRDIKDHVDQHVEDVDYMMKESASFIVGDPDECVRQVREYDRLGIDELWLRIDSMRHEDIVRTLERFGKYVIPHFKNPASVVRAPDDVLASIREARPHHARRLEEFTAALSDGASPHDAVAAASPTDGK